MVKAEFKAGKQPVAMPACSQLVHQGIAHEGNDKQRGHIKRLDEGE